MSKDWPPALPVYMAIPPEFSTPGRMYSALSSNVDFGFSASFRSAADVNGALARYPGSVGAVAATYNGK